MPFELFADATDSDSHLCIDRFDGEVQDGSYFLIFQAIFPNEFENHFSTGRKLINGLFDSVQYFLGD